MEPQPTGALSADGEAEARQQQQQQQSGGVSPSRFLVRLLRQWLWSQDSRSCSQTFSVPSDYLLPAFPAKIAYAIRGCLGIAISTVILFGVPQLPLRNPTLLPVACIFVMLDNLASTGLAATRVVSGGLLGLAYSVVVVAILPSTVYASLSALALGTLFVSYIEASSAFKRFALGDIILTLVPWYIAAPQSASDAVTGAVYIFISIIIGAAIGLVITVIPLPFLPAATWEGRLRLLSVTRSLRNEFAALVLTFNEGAAVVPPSSGGTGPVASEEAPVSPSSLFATGGGEGVSLPAKGGSNGLELPPAGIPSPAIPAGAILRSRTTVLLPLKGRMETGAAAALLSPSRVTLLHRQRVSTYASVANSLVDLVDAADNSPMGSPVEEGKGAAEFRRADTSGAPLGGLGRHVTMRSPPGRENIAPRIVPQLLELPYRAISGKRHEEGEEEKEGGEYAATPAASGANARHINVSTLPPPTSAAVRSRSMPAPQASSAAAAPPPLRATVTGSPTPAVSSSVGDGSGSREEGERMPARDSEASQLAAPMQPSTAPWLPSERVPLLRADVSDLHNHSGRELGLLQAVIGDAAADPLRSLSVWVSSCNPWVTRDSGGAAPPILWQLQRWQSTSARLHRILRMAESAESKISAGGPASIHTRYLGYISEPLACLCEVLVVYKCLAAEYIASQGAMVGLCAGASCTTDIAALEPDCHSQTDAESMMAELQQHGERGEITAQLTQRGLAQRRHVSQRLLQLAAMRQEVEAALADFLRSFQLARLQMFYNALLDVHAASWRGSGSAAMLTPWPATPAGDARDSAALVSSTHTAGSTTGAAAALVASSALPPFMDDRTHRQQQQQPVQVPVLVQQGAGGAPSRHSADEPGAAGEHSPFHQQQMQERLQWHSNETIAVCSFLFSCLRYAQTVLAAVDETCLAGTPVAAPLAAAPSTDGSPPTPQAGGRGAGASMLACTSSTRAAAVRFARAWGLGLSKRQFLRATRVTVAVVVAAIVSAALQVQFATSFTVWAPITAAFVSGGPDTGVFRISEMRIAGSVLGAVYGYMVVRVCNGDVIAISVLLALFCGVTQFVRTNPRYAYIAVVSAFTAVITTLGFVGGKGTIDALALGRIEETLLGLVIFVIASSLIFPVSARNLSRRLLVSNLTTLGRTTRASIGEFVSWAVLEAAEEQAQLLAARTGTADAPPATQPAAATAPPFDPTTALDGIDAALRSLPELLADAAAEPSLWRPSFSLLKERQMELAGAVRRATAALRALYQCSVSLHAEAKLRHEAALAVAAAAAARGGVRASSLRREGGKGGAAPPAGEGKGRPPAAAAPPLGAPLPRISSGADVRAASATGGPYTHHHVSRQIATSLRAQGVDADAGLPHLLYHFAEPLMERPHSALSVLAAAVSEQLGAPRDGVALLSDAEQQQLDLHQQQMEEQQLHWDEEWTSRRSGLSHFAPLLPGIAVIAAKAAQVMELSAAVLQAPIDSVLPPAAKAAPARGSGSAGRVDNAELLPSVSEEGGGAAASGGGGRSTGEEAMELLPSAVEAMCADLQVFLGDFDSFLRRHVAKAVATALRHQRLQQQQGEGEPAMVLPLSNVDSLTFNCIAFGVQELAAAVTDIARTTRRTRHAELRSRVFA